MRQATQTNGKRGTRWTLTLNHYTPEHLIDLKALVDQKKITYLCYGLERASTTGTPHIQGYLQLPKKLRLNGLKAMLPGSPHLELAKGTLQQNITYCSKDGEFFELGEAVSPGARTDLQAVQQLIKDGASDLEIADASFNLWTRYHKAFALYRRMINLPRTTTSFLLEDFPEDWRTLSTFPFRTSLILAGLPSIGKTEFAKVLLPGALMCSHMDDLGLFDPTVHSGIIFDDMEFVHIPRSAQIHLVDVDNDRSIHVRYKTAFIPKNTKKIFTTNLDAIFLDDAAINRRISLHNLYKT